MFFRSITTNIIIITLFTILLVGTSIFYLTLQEHEKLYRIQVKNDLTALSVNLSDDLVKIMAEEVDNFELAKLLLRLDKYDNIYFAKVFDINWQLIEPYYGKALAYNPIVHEKMTTQLFSNSSIGISYLAKKIISIQRVGDRKLPLGYLVVVKDYLGPINQSKMLLFYKVLPTASFITVFALFFLFFKHYKMLSPLSRLSRFAKEVKNSKNYSLRIEQTGKYEIADLTSNINSMMEAIDSEVNKNQQNTKKILTQKHTMEHMANFDALTKLPNRHSFMQTLKTCLVSAENNASNLSLMFIDLDGFKDVNDNYGHTAGDKLLIYASKRMEKCLRGGGVLSRLGGDEFVVLLPDNLNNNIGRSISERILLELNYPFNIDSWSINISASIGISNAKDSNFDVGKIVTQADIAMYQSKLKGKGTFTTFSFDMLEKSRRSFQVANSIKDALEQNEFYLVYQAKVDKNKEVVGFETLIRWTSKELGIISPVEFIPLAEQNSKIFHITKWVILHLCMEFEGLLALQKRPVIVSVNLSAKDLKQPSLIDYIKTQFHNYNVDPSMIQFEVTESAYLEDFDNANIFFNKIKAIGCTLALDDFGTGYSSLSYLTQIPFDTLKIDKQFIDHIGVSKRTTLVTNTIIIMAKGLGVKVCAEGVENWVQFNYLIAANCDHVQGYLFSKPCSLIDMIESKKKPLPQENVVNLKLN
ncbi:MAG: diguanylate cyclase (GGDEF)-like protein [Cognaticolwellia sp.]|jgi:diguanylate cyclase (GGDEF)-like protein